MQQNKQIQFKEESYRWVVLVIFALLTAVNGMSNAIVPPIATTLSRLYNVSSAIINIIPMLGLVIFALVNLPANYFIDQKGIRLGLCIGSILFVLGSVITMLVNQNFIFLILGSVFISLSQPFILNCAAKIPTFWFFKQKRTGMVTLLTLSNLLGTGFGFVLPTIVVDQNSTTFDGKSQTFTLLLIQFIISLISSILVFIFMKDKPESPPSLGSQTDKTPFRESLKDMLKNSNFMILTMGYMLFLGPINTLGSLLNFLMVPYNFTNFQISIFGVVLLVAGVLGCGIVSFIVSKTLKYSLTNKILSGVSIILIIIIYLSLLYFINFEVLLILLFLIGLFVTPLFPLGFDFGCQIAFPIGQAQITGSLNSVAYLSSFLIILINQFAIGFGTQNQSSNNFLIFIVLMFIGSIFYWFTKNDLRRRALQQNENKNERGIQIQMENKKITQMESESNNDLITKKNKIESNNMLVVLPQQKQTI